MTIEELLDCSPEVLEKITDKELEEHFKPFLTVTRPEFIVKKSVGKEPERVYIDPKKQQILELLKDSGVDTSFMNHRKRKS